jgi:hypothetical protein
MNLKNKKLFIYKTGRSIRETHVRGHVLGNSIRKSGIMIIYD